MKASDIGYLLSPTLSQCSQS